MATDPDKYKLLTEKIIGCAFTVHRTLGSGFLEKVYENAMLIELKDANLKVEAQKPLDVYYKNQLVGSYYADLVVENEIIVELKVASALEPAHEAQLVSYLKATGFPIGLLLNFGTQSLGIKRKLHG